MYKYDNLCIDAVNLFWRCSAIALKKFLDLEGHPVYTKTIELFIKRFNNLKESFGYIYTNTYLLFDNPFSKINIRKVLSKGKYKHARILKTIPRNLYNTLNVLEEILKVYCGNMYIIRGENLEADDLTLPLKKYLNSKKNCNTLFISNDLDWARNIDTISHWYNYATVYTMDIFKDKYKFYPDGNAIKIYKAIRGDNADCIENAVPYLPESILVDIVTRFKDLDTLFKEILKTEYPSKWKFKIYENRNKIKSNYQLVDFLEFDKDIDDCLIPCKENVKMLSLWFDILGLTYEGRMCNNNGLDFFRAIK